MRTVLRITSIVALIASTALFLIFALDAFGDTTREASLIETAAQSNSLSNIAETTLGHSESAAAIALRAKYGSESAHAEGELIALRTQKIEDRRASCEFLIAALLAGILFMLTTPPISSSLPG